MHALVTGAGGYTGGRLARRLLEEGHQVRALVRRPHQAPALRDAGARVVLGDLAHPATLAGITAGIDVVYHLAGALAGGSVGIRRALVEGSRNLLAQCHAIRGEPPAVIFTSNAVVYGNGRRAVLDEESPCRPAFPLGSITLEAEEVLRAAHCGPQTIAATILRCGAIYGPGRLSSELIRQERFRLIGSGRNWSSRIHVDDLVTALIALGASPRGGAIYCAADREPCAVNDYYEYLADALGAPFPTHRSAWRVRQQGRARAFLTLGRATDLDANVIGLFTADLRLDGSRLWRDLGLTPRWPSYRAGIPASLAMEQGSEATPHP
ncbi:MAG TPA: NAD-dependent epimerase/dehydratase family protein [Chloroflexota bacterium]|nr:NAD-dependent epimerase/dehydratase family protein [Chloroflexota bacterium]